MKSKKNPHYNLIVLLWYGNAFSHQTQVLLTNKSSKLNKVKQTGAYINNNYDASYLSSKQVRVD